MRIEPKAIAFDLDDTLWSCDDVIERAERALYAWLGEHYPAITDEFGLEDMRSVRHEAMAREPALAADLSALRRHTLRWHARRAAYDEALAERALDVFLAERNRVQLYEDVLPVLEHLSARTPLVALTNGNADLGRIGLDHLFAVRLSAADVGAAKPHPAMFHAACERLALRPGDLVHVGDDPHRDVHAARRFGARTVWVNRVAADWPDGVPRAHHEIVTLEPLPQLVYGESAEPVVTK
ncbi:MAG TPA: HAD-IA family hydrolase [Kiloniellales bacterium]|nr:HAD-IA family hydrolase [Kiloniellales bacterium]